MDNHISSEEIANQLAKAIVLILEWVKQEIPAKSQTNTMRPVQDRSLVGDAIQPVANRLLKAKEVSETLQVSRSQVYRMMQLGEIPTVRVGTAVRVRPSDLEEFIKKGKGM